MFAIISRLELHKGFYSIAGYNYGANINLERSKKQLGGNFDQICCTPCGGYNFVFILIFAKSIVTVLQQIEVIMKHQMLLRWVLPPLLYIIQLIGAAYFKLPEKLQSIVFGIKQTRFFSIQLV
jgi:hypothetical protein